MRLFIKAFACCLAAMLWSCLLYAQPKINRVEYYIDKDPGYGKATAVSITSAVNLSNVAININPSTLSSGVHILGVRAKDENGAWSLDNRLLFAKPYPNDTATGPVPQITRVEYYLDKDPGYGKATAVSITPGINISNIGVNINPATLTSGVHVFGIRARDAKGSWSLDNRWLFAKPYASDTVSAGPVPNIKQIEYYIDKDPGYGKGTPVAIQSITNIANFNLSVNISNLSTGSHTIYIRSKDAKNVWSLDNKYDFSVAGTVAAPSVTVNSTSKKTLCAGEVFSVGFDAKGTFNTGNIFTVQLSNSAGTFTSPIAIGTVTGKVSAVAQCTLPDTLSSGSNYKVRVVSSNPAKTSTVSTDKLNITALPAKPIITASGSTTICQGDSVTLTSSTATTYKWSTGATTRSIKAGASGKYAVTVANSNGCTATSDTTVVSYKGCANPAGLTVSNIKASAATFKWKSVPCATTYNVQYKKTSATTWTSAPATTDTTLTVTGLTAGTTYNWRVQTVCTTPVSGFTNGTNFTTAATLMAVNGDMKMQGAFTALVYPNPAASNATVQITGALKQVNIALTDMAGKVLWKAVNIKDMQINLPVEKLSAGIYMIIVTDGNTTKFLKLVRE